MQNKMSRGKEYLTFIIDRLKVRIRELNETIQEGIKDIEGMNEYYWENYTEMDEYGYENYDNQQALLARVGANQENLKTQHRLKRMLGDPFFGSVDFVYNGEDEPETFYIGIGNFAEKRGNIPLIYDWRAPVSGLFYDYDKGAASYEAPAGIMEGEILSKRQYKIRGGRMLYEFESDVKIDDDILKQELGANSDTKLKNIVHTIQREQNAIIRNTKDKILAIQGVAGSGKTSVALHRIAYLLYHDREHLNSSNVLILSPNSVFSDYISHILPELGEENIQEMSFDLFAYRELKGIVCDCEDRYHQIEKRIAGNSSVDEARFRWKQSEEFVIAVEGFLIELEDRLVDFQDVEYKGFKKKAGEILDFFYNRFTDIPVLSRMGAVMEYFIDEYETLCGRNLQEEEQEYIRDKFESMYVTMDVCDIYNWLLEDYGWPALPKIPAEERVLEYEDVYPVLYLKYRLNPASVRRNIRHLVIDEMQDYSYLQYVILKRLFDCNMTILGDKAQTVDDKMQDVLAFLPKIFGKQVRRITMNKSYRNTAEIAEYAKEICAVTGIEYVARHGKNVEEWHCQSMSEAYGKMLDNVRLSSDGCTLTNGVCPPKSSVTVCADAYETAAVLTMTEAEALEAYKYLSSVREDVSYIDRDSSRFCKGITVTTFYLAKGLEFDQVFVLGGDEENPFWKQYQYICATRALHELYVCCLRKM